MYFCFINPEHNMLIYRTHNATSRNAPQNQIAYFKNLFSKELGNKVWILLFCFTWTMEVPSSSFGEFREVVCDFIPYAPFVCWWQMWERSVNSSGASLGVETVHILMVDDGCSTWAKWGNYSHVSQSHSSPRTNKNECINDLPGYSGKLLNG